MVLEHWPRGIRIRMPTGIRSSGGDRGTISQFSESSRRRLSWVYAQGPWKSMITLTYHNDFPDGVESKRQLQVVLQYLRDRRIQYLWILEWQHRGVPHYHIWLDHEFDDCPLSEDFSGNSWRPIVRSWLRASGQDNDSQAVSFALHQRAYTSWRVLAGCNYAAKYASKQEQKGLPVSVESYGRWWGCSRGVNKPVSVFLYDEEDSELRKTSTSVRRNLHRAVQHLTKSVKRRPASRGITLVADNQRLSTFDRICHQNLPRSSVFNHTQERAHLFRIATSRALPPISTYHENFSGPEKSALPFGSSLYIMPMPLQTQSGSWWRLPDLAGSAADDVMSVWVRHLIGYECSIKPSDVGAILGTHNRIAEQWRLFRRNNNSDEAAKNLLKFVDKYLRLGYIVVDSATASIVEDWRALPNWVRQ